MTKSGRFSRRQKRISSAKACFVARLDPKLRRTADAQGGVFRDRLVKTHFAFFAHDLLQFFRDHQLGRENRQLLVNISRAETKDEIARRPACCRHRDADVIESRLISDAAMAVR